MTDKTIEIGNNQTRQTASSQRTIIRGYRQKMNLSIVRTFELYR